MSVSLLIYGLADFETKVLWHRTKTITKRTLDVINPQIDLLSEQSVGSLKQ